MVKGRCVWREVRALYIYQWHKKLAAVLLYLWVADGVLIPWQCPVMNRLQFLVSKTTQRSRINSKPHPLSSSCGMSANRVEYNNSFSSFPRLGKIFKKSVRSRVINNNQGKLELTHTTTCVITFPQKDRFDASWLLSRGCRIFGGGVKILHYTTKHQLVRRELLPWCLSYGLSWNIWLVMVKNKQLGYMCSEV